MRSVGADGDMRLANARSLCLVICSSVFPPTVCCANTLCFAIAMSPVDSTWRCVPHYTSWQYSAWGVMCQCMNLLYQGSWVLSFWCFGWVSCTLQDQDGAWDLRGIPSHEFGLLRTQVLSRPVFVARLCFSQVADVEVVENVSQCERCRKRADRMEHGIWDEYPVMYLVSCALKSSPARLLRRASASTSSLVWWLKWMHGKMSVSARGA